MKLKLLATCILGMIGFSSYAQFNIDLFVHIDQYQSENVFPLVRSHKYPDAARRVNTILHYNVLNKVYRVEDNQRFDEVLPEEGEFHGAGDFSYEILANNKRFFSVAITSSYTGAYSEFHTEYFNFDAESGQPIFLNDLFAESAYYDLSDWVTSAIYEKIRAFMDTIDTENAQEYSQEQYEMYDECSQFYTEVELLSNEYFYLTDSTITFVKGRCSNHMMAALDDLWEFHEVYDLSELQSMMSDNGVALLEGKPLAYDHMSIPEGKILEGRIGGRYPITMILNNAYDDHFSGVYWYDKVKSLISLNGNVDEIAYVHLDEKVGDKVTGVMDLQIMSGGSLKGEWKSADGSKKFEMSVQIAQ